MTSGSFFAQVVTLDGMVAERTIGSQKDRLEKDSRVVRYCSSGVSSTGHAFRADLRAGGPKVVRSQ